MKKKFCLLLLAMPMAIGVFGQTDDPAVSNIDFEEDTVHVNTLNEIIAMQDLVYDKNYRSRMLRNVWKRKRFFTLSYANTTMSGENLWLYDMANGSSDPSDNMKQQDKKYKSDWGIALKRSNIVAFHKKPIADILSFGLEYSVLDVAVNHYSKDKDLRYDSRAIYEEEVDDGPYSNKEEYHYMPWGSEMYTFAYGIHLGPSISLAPFAKLKSQGAAHIRLQAYFTVGYRASFLWMRADNKQDLNYLDRGTASYVSADYDAVKNSSKLSWAHGLVTTWGIRLSWKGIGLGYEVTNGGYKYQSIEKNIYGSHKSKFTETSQRISLSYIW